VSVIFVLEVERKQTENLNRGPNEMGGEKCNDVLVSNAAAPFANCTPYLLNPYDQNAQGIEMGGPSANTAHHRTDNKQSLKYLLFCGK
jgi:hypothetical protein